MVSVLFFFFLAYEAISRGSSFSCLIILELVGREGYWTYLKQVT